MTAITFYIPINQEFIQGFSSVEPGDAILIIGKPAATSSFGSVNPLDCGHSNHLGVSAQNAQAFVSVGGDAGPGPRLGIIWVVGGFPHGDALPKGTKVSNVQKIVGTTCFLTGGGSIPDATEYQRYIGDTDE